jgi:hypothetical protein
MSLTGPLILQEESGVFEEFGCKQSNLKESSRMRTRGNYILTTINATPAIERLTI